MTTKRLLTLSALLVATAAATTALSQATRQPDPAPGAPGLIPDTPASLAANPFQGKYLTVISRTSPEEPFDLNEVTQRPFAGRSFLVGKGAKLPGYWLSDRTIWIALDDVAQIVEYDSLDQLLDAAVVGEEP